MQVRYMTNSAILHMTTDPGLGTFLDLDSQGAMHN
jgi:hypothetical protein